MSVFLKTPEQIVAAYENGLPGWQFHPNTMSVLWRDGREVSGDRSH